MGVNAKTQARKDGEIPLRRVFPLFCPATYLM